LIRLVSLFVAALFVSTLVASTLVMNRAAAGQQSAALENVDKYLADCYQRLENATPGFAVVLVDHDRVAYLKAFGIDSIFGRRPFTVDAACPVGSLAQSFTALGVTQLAQQGKLDLDAPVVKYLP
jgi:CubicO group peptidase (beta-lactamase class C family)